MPRGPSTSDVTCPVSRAIGVFQEKWVLHIVHTLLSGPRGFNELGRDAGGCNPTTLAQRLARLEELGLVHRSCEAEGGRSAYALTEAGEALRHVIDAIHAWSDKHLGEDGVAHAAVEVPKVEPVRTRHPAVDAAVPPARPTLGRARLRAGEERGEAQVLRPVVLTDAR